jgi:hypothetical protein
MGKRVWLTAMSLVVAQALWSTSVFAEGVIEVYAGPSFTDNARVTAGKDPSRPASGNVSFGTDLTYGIRGGYWFAKVPWLFIGGDLASQHATGDHASFDITPLSLLLLFRLPLFVSDAIPQGRVQPYVGIGPSVSFYTYATTDIGSGVNNSGVTRGVLLPAGFKVQLSRHLALFGEYRFTYHDINIESTSFLFGNRFDHVEATLTGHNLLFGAAYHF